MYENTRDSPAVSIDVRQALALRFSVFDSHSALTHHVPPLHRSGSRGGDHKRKSYKRKNPNNIYEAAMGKRKHGMAGKGVCCVEAGRRALYACNLFFAIVGVALVCLCTYVLNFTVEFLPRGSTILVSEGAMYGGIVAGSVIMVVSAAGCVGARRLSTSLLLLYSTIMLVLTLAQISMGVAFIAVSLRLQRAQSETTTPSSDDLTGEQLERAVHEVHYFCCVGVNQTVPADDKLCTMIEGDCSSYGRFRRSVLSFFGSYQLPIGAVILGLAVVQLVALFYGCHLMCHGKRHMNRLNNTGSLFSRSGSYSKPGSTEDDDNEGSLPLYTNIDSFPHDFI